MRSARVGVTIAGRPGFSASDRVDVNDSILSLSDSFEGAERIVDGDDDPPLNRTSIAVFFGAINTVSLRHELADDDRSEFSKYFNNFSDASFRRSPGATSNDDRSRARSERKRAASRVVSVRNRSAANSNRRSVPSSPNSRTNSATNPFAARSPPSPESSPLSPSDASLDVASPAASAVAASTTALPIRARRRRANARALIMENIPIAPAAVRATARVTASPSLDVASESAWSIGLPRARCAFHES